MSRHTTDKWQDDDFVKTLRYNGFDTSEWVLEWVSYNFEPQDVFDEEELSAWAESNGYVKGEN